MTGPAAAPSVTVTVLTYDGERYLDELLTAVERQEYPGEVETLVIDSGSTDRTLAIVAAHPGVRLHEIPNAEFGHGRTRNLAARLARGEIVAYLTHDAVPADEHWLAELVAPLADDERIGAVVGRQLARPGTPPVVKYDIRRVFERLGPDYAVSVVGWAAGGRELSEAEKAAASFYSDANSAARRSILTGPVPYRDVDYAEDQRFARDLLDAGWRKAYAPRGAVEHSNDTTLATFGSRIAADLVGLRRIGVEVAPVSRLAAVKQWVKWSAADAAMILIDPEYGALRRLRWLIVNPWYHAAKWRAYRRATLQPL